MAIIAQVLENPHLLQGLAVTLLLVVVSSFYRELADGLPYRNIPIVGTSGWRLSNSKAKQQFVSSAKEIIASGFGQVCNRSCALSSQGENGRQACDTGTAD